jgi:hypothetical protein
MKIPSWFDGYPSLAWPDQLEVPPHVEAVARWDLVLVHDLFGHRLVIGENSLVASADESPLGSP